MSNLHVYLFRNFCLAFVFNNDSGLFTLDRCVLPSVPQPKSGRSVYIFIDEKFYKTLMNQRHHLKYYIFIKSYKVCSKNWNKQRFVDTRSVK